MRLIDADELKQAILIERDKIPLTLPGAIYELGIAKTNHFGNAMRGGIRKALRCMEQCKTADAVPVVHGRWRYDSYNMRYYCTECDEEPCKYTKTFLDGSTLTEEFLTDYCPNCGAKMDGDGNGKLHDSD